MAGSLHVVLARGAGTNDRRTSASAPVGASYGFDPTADGIAGIYAARVLERGVDPRTLCAEVRADRLGSTDRESRRRALHARPRASRFGRGTAIHLQSAAPRPPSMTALRKPRFGARSRPARSDRPPRRPRQLAIAGLLALLLFPLGIILAHAQEKPIQSRYIVQPGDTLEAVAAEFGVDPAAMYIGGAPLGPGGREPSSAARPRSPEVPQVRRAPTASLDQHEVDESLAAPSVGAATAREEQASGPVFAVGVPAY